MRQNGKRDAILVINIDLGSLKQLNGIRLSKTPNILRRSRISKKNKSNSIFTKPSFPPVDLIKVQTNFFTLMKVQMALLSTESHRMPLNGIYRWIENHFPYFKAAELGWRSSISTLLSTRSDLFYKEPSMKAWWRLKNDIPGKLQLIFSEFK